MIRGDMWRSDCLGGDGFFSAVLRTSGVSGQGHRGGIDIEYWGAVGGIKRGEIPSLL
jgi:hypothetical protein